VWPAPGICDKAFFRVDNIAFTTGLLAEFGFLGVQIRRRSAMPFLCGDPLNLGLLSFVNFLNLEDVLWFIVDI